MLKLDLLLIPMCPESKHFFPELDTGLFYVISLTDRPQLFHGPLEVGKHCGDGQRELISIQI